MGGARNTKGRGQVNFSDKLLNKNTTLKSSNLFQNKRPATDAVTSFQNANNERFTDVLGKRDEQ